MGLEADERVYGEGVWNNNFVDNLVTNKLYVNKNFTGASDKGRYR